MAIFIAIYVNLIDNYRVLYLERREMSSTGMSTQEARIIDFIARNIDTDKLASDFVPEDAMLKLIQAKFKQGVPIIEAISLTISSLESYSAAILDCLSYSSSTITGISLEQRLKTRGLEFRDTEIAAAVASLISRGRLAKLKPPTRLTQDDIEWLTGTGRFAQ